VSLKRLAVLSGTVRAGFDPAAQAVFDAWPASTPSSTKIAVNDAIVALKTIGAWDDFDLLYPFGAARQAGANLSERAAASQVNWKSPGTFNCIPVNAPTYDDTDGTWQGDGASARLRTQWTPSTDAASYALNDASLCFWSLTTGNSGFNDIGCVSGAGFATLAVNLSNTVAVRMNDLGTDVLDVAPDTTGLYMAQRPDAANKKIFWNGVQVGTAAIASNGLPTVEVWALGSNNNTFSNRKCMFAAAGASFVGKEAAIYSIFQTLFQATGALP